MDMGGWFCKMVRVLINGRQGVDDRVRVKVGGSWVCVGSVRVVRLMGHRKEVVQEV